jgi:hypothetical protein
MYTAYLPHKICKNPMTGLGDESCQWKGQFKQTLGRHYTNCTVQGSRLQSLSEGRTVLLPGTLIDNKTGD